MQKGSFVQNSDYVLIFYSGIPILRTSKANGDWFENLEKTDKCVNARTNTVDSPGKQNVPISLVIKIQTTEFLFLHQFGQKLVANLQLKKSKFQSLNIWPHSCLTEKY